MIPLVVLLCRIFFIEEPAHFCSDVSQNTEFYLLQTKILLMFVVRDTWFLRYINAIKGCHLKEYSVYFFLDSLHIGLHC